MMLLGELINESVCVMQFKVVYLRALTHGQRVHIPSCLFHPVATFAKGTVPVFEHQFECVLL